MEKNYSKKEVEILIATAIASREAEIVAEIDRKFFEVEQWYANQDHVTRAESCLKLRELRTKLLSITHKE